MNNISCNVHVRDNSNIACDALVANGSVTNTVDIDGLTIFASADLLRRLADAINARLAVIDAEALEVAARAPPPP